MKLAAGLLLGALALAACGPSASLDQGVLTDASATLQPGDDLFLVQFEAEADLTGVDQIEDWDERGRVVMERLQEMEDLVGGEDHRHQEGINRAVHQAQRHQERHHRAHQAPNSLIFILQEILKMLLWPQVEASHRHHHHQEQEQFLIDLQQLGPHKQYKKQKNHLSLKYSHHHTIIFIIITNHQIQILHFLS